jgi:hypothetical protein
MAQVCMVVQPQNLGEHLVDRNLLIRQEIGNKHRVTHNGHKLAHHYGHQLGHPQGNQLALLVRATE